MKLLLRLLKNEEGPATVEYAVMIAMILGLCFASISSFGGQVGGSFDNSANEANTAMNEALSKLN